MSVVPGSDPRATEAPDAVVDRIFVLFERRGSQAYLGEPVSMTEHMVQAAALAEHEGAAPELVAAALLHDLGHLVHGMADDSADHGIDTLHEDAGAAWLAPWFTERVVEAVRLHVAAKRYLCTAEPAYLAELSPASVHSLHLQGGPYDTASAEAFAARAGAADAVQVRRWDDRAKTAGLAVPPLEHFRGVLRAALRPPA